MQDGQAECQRHKEIELHGGRLWMDVDALEVLTGSLGEFYHSHVHRSSF